MTSTLVNSTYSAPQNSTAMKSTAFTAVGVLVVTLTITVTVIGDCLIFAAFFSSVSIRTRANLFFLSLITADIFQAVTVMPLELVRIVHYPLWPVSVAATKLWNSMFVCFGTASVLQLGGHWCRKVSCHISSVRAQFRYHFKKCPRGNNLRLALRHLEWCLKLICLENPALR